MSLSSRLFAGCYPTGIVYADREVDDPKTRDYKRLAYLNYGTLELDIEKECPPDLRREIVADAGRLQARKGERFQIAGNQHVTLGSDLDRKVDTYRAFRHLITNLPATEPVKEGT